jgi:Co/Zn/Cd efflux system component
MYKSIYHISKMDCLSEENLIRMKLEGIASIKKLDLDINNRNLTIFHTENNTDIEIRLNDLELGSKRIDTSVFEEKAIIESPDFQSKLLWYVLIINISFFVIEIITGFLSKSMGLAADSLDMLADALVYGLSLWAVGSTIVRKKRIALMSGYFQLTLAVLGFIEVVRRFIGFESLPDFRTMIIVSFLALIANAICLYLLQKSKSQEAHMKASMIFTSNDIIINAGVVIAGVLVFITNTKYPDLIIGAIVFVIVIRGAMRILKLGKEPVSNVYKVFLLPNVREI